MRRTVLENGRNSDIVSGNIVAADTMSFQIGLKVNQRMLRYGIEDNVELAEPVDVFREKILCPMNFTGIMRMLAQK